MMEISGDKTFQKDYSYFKEYLGLFNELKKLVVLEVENSEIERMRAILPAKIIKLEEIILNKIRLSFEFDNMAFLNQQIQSRPPSLICRPETPV